MSTFIKNQSSRKLTQLKKLTFDELKTEFEKLVKSIENFMPMEANEKEKRKKQIARKGIHIDKSTQDEDEEENARLHKMSSTRKEKHM
ncbi:hypothetical protein Tco_0287065 [Tanacetum coccineum]